MAVRPPAVRRAAVRVGGLLPRPSDWTMARRTLRRDLPAGLAVAVVALPLALAFGVSSGLGAGAGLVTAVVAGAVAAVFGGSNLQVSGPTGAMTVVLVPVVAAFGPTGVLMVGAMAGAILIVLALARVGRYVRYLPAPVIEGFTAGIAVVIALQQVPAALGVAGAHGAKVWAVAADAVVRFVADPAPAPVLTALGVAAAMLIGGRWRPQLPWSLIAVAAATALAALLHADVARIGALPGLPGPSLSFLDLHAVSRLAPSALAVAALAALESLLCATVADAMSVGQRHDPDRELFGQGLANLVVPIFGGVPATAAIARTAVNVRAGAASRLAALTHAAVLAGIVLAAAPLVAGIPLAALAGVLLATAIRMVEASALLALARSTRGDALVLGLTFVVTVAVDLVSAVAVGLGVAVVLALRAVARTAPIVTTAPSSNAAGSPGRNVPDCAPMVAAATGTPSCALVSPVRGSGCPVRRIAAWMSAAPAPSATPRPISAGCRPNARISNDAPNHTKNTGPKKPSVTANSCLASRRGSPTAATTRPKLNPANMTDT